MIYNEIGVVGITHPLSMELWPYDPKPAGIIACQTQAGRSLYTN